MTDALGLYCALAGMVLAWLIFTEYIVRIWGKPFSTWGLHWTEVVWCTVACALLVTGTLL